MTNVNTVWETFLEYTGSYFWCGLFFLAIILIVLLQKNKETRIGLVLILAVALLVLYNDQTRNILSLITDSSTYYRFFWLVPIGFIVALASVLILSSVKKKGIKVFFTLALMLLIFKFATPFSSLGSCSHPENGYLLPDELIELSEGLQEQINVYGYETLDNKLYPCAAMPLSVDMQYRTYDASVQMGIGRFAYHYLGQNGYTDDANGKYHDQMILAGMLENQAIYSTEEIQQSITNLSVDYIVCPKQGESFFAFLEAGSTYLFETGNYYVLKTDLPSETSSAELFDDKDIVVNRVSITSNQLQEAHSIAVVNDMHDFMPDKTISQENKATVIERYLRLFITQDGIHSRNVWEKMPDAINAENPELVLLDGDMIDYFSPINISHLGEGLERIQADLLYLRADHDLGRWYYEEGDKPSKKEVISQHKTIAPYDDVFVYDMGDLVVLGWNNSTSQMTEEGLETARPYLTGEKPVLLATHVPLNSRITNTLYDASTNFDPEGRAKLWGEGCLYEPDETTAEFLDLVLSDNSPVMAVVSGHLHFYNETYLTESIPQYVFDTGFHGILNIVTLTP